MEPEECYKEFKKYISMFLENNKDHIDHKFLKKIVDEACHYNLRKNDALYRVMYDNIYVSMDTLKEALDKRKETDIIIYFEEKNRYILFDSISNYAVFMRNVVHAKLGGIGDYNDEEYAEHFGKIIKYQIIPTTHKQKLILACDPRMNIEYLQELKDHIKKCFNLESEAEITFNAKWNNYQIIVDKIIESQKDAQQYLYQLKDYLAIKNPQLGSNMRPAQISHDRQTDLHYLDSMLSELTDDDNYLKRIIIVPIIVNNNTINGNGNNIINGNGNNIIIQEKPDVDKITSDWVAANLPKHRASTTAYHNTYKKHMDTLKLKPLHLSKFSEIVKGNGYDIKKPGKIHLWFKN